jgi:hypothetical protein
MIHNPHVLANLRLAVVDEPVAGQPEAAIRVCASAPDFGEVHYWRSDKSIRRSDSVSRGEVFPKQPRRCWDVGSRPRRSWTWCDRRAAF